MSDIIISIGRSFKPTTIASLWAKQKSLSTFRFAKMFHNESLKLLFLCVMGLFHFVSASGQTLFEVSEDMTVDFSKAKIQVSELAKRARASKRSGGGKIILNYVDGIPVSEEWLASLDVATDIWQDYLPLGDTLRIDVYFEENLATDISLSIQYQLETNKKYIYPSVLVKKLFKEDFGSFCDAKVHINTSVDWSFGIGEEHANVSKNLTLAFMQCICKSLGFGSSVRLGRRGSIEFSQRSQASIFDSFIVCDNGSRLTDFIANGSGLKQFSTGGMGNVYFSSGNITSKLYAPSVFDANNSLKCIEDANSLMYHNKENASRDLIVDDLTLNILNELGWDFAKSSQTIAIVSDDIDETGITSAYTSHSFHISPNTVNFTNWMWKLVLPLEDGSSVVACSSDNSTFTIPPIANPEQYAHTIEGDIRGVVVFEGVADGNAVCASYPIIFELKPRIMSARIVSTNVNAENPYYFDATVEIRYEGSHYIHAYVEEEDNPYLTSYYSSTPYYTKMHLTNIASWGEAWLDITVRNEYGSDNYVLDLPYTETEAVVPSGSTTGTAIEEIESRNASHIAVYDVYGKYVGLYDSCKGSLPKGIYLVKSHDAKNICKKAIKLCVE